MPMEAKLLRYRRRKQRYAMVEAVRNSMKEVLSWQRNPATATEDTDDLESLMSEDSVDLTSPPTTIYTRAIIVLYFLLWLTLYVIAIKVEFGSVYLVSSMLVFICLNTRSGGKEKGEISAYSVFNVNCHSIAGTLNAEQFEQEIRYGPLSVR